MFIVVQMTGEEVRQALFDYVLEHLKMSRACFDMDKSSVETTDYREIRDANGSVAVTLAPLEIGA